MKPRSLGWQELFTLTVLALVPPFTHGATHRDDERHFTLEVPEGWKNISQQEIATRNRDAQQQTPHLKILFIGGFERVSQRQDGLPYVLLQWEPIKATTTYEELERTLQSSGLRIQSPEAELKNLAVGEAVIDRTRNRMIARTRPGPQGQEIDSIMIGCLGKEGILYLQCYDSPSSFSLSLPTFANIAQSFTYDPGFDFAPGTAAKKKSVVAILAGVGGLIAAILAVVFVKSQRKPAKSK